MTGLSSNMLYYFSPVNIFLFYLLFFLLRALESFKHVCFLDNPVSIPLLHLQSVSKTEVWRKFLYSNFNFSNSERLLLSLWTSNTQNTDKQASVALVY